MADSRATSFVRALWRFLRSRSEQIPAVALSVVALVVTGNLFWFFVRAPNAVGFDDGYTVALGERLLDRHWLPYVDGCSHRGPLLYWLVAIAQRTSGRFNWSGVAWLMMLTGFATVLGFYACGVAAKKPMSGALAGLFYCFVPLSTHQPESAFAVDGEPISAAFGVIAVAFATAGVMRSWRFRSKAACLFMAGAFAACAGLVKQTALPIVVPIGLWVLAEALSADALSRRQRVLLLAALGGGFATPFAIVVARYAFAHALSDFWYWFYVYNMKVYMAPYRTVPFRPEFDEFLAHHSWELLVVALVVTAAVPRLFLDARTPSTGRLRAVRGFVRAYAEHGYELTTALLVLVMFAAISSPMRFWPPYFIAYYPFLALALGVRGALVLERASITRLARFAGEIAMGAVVVSWVGYTAHMTLTRLVQERRHGRWQPALPEKMCDVFDQYSKPSDSVFIWGFDGDLYVTCHRHPATRYMYLTLVAGAVPPFWKDLRAERVARDSRTHIMEDLRESKPKLILDMPGLMRGVSLSVVPELAAYVKKEYCRVGPRTTQNGRAATVYARKDLDVCRLPEKKR